MKRAATLLLLYTVSLAALTLQLAHASDQVREEQLGREYASKIEQECKLVEDEAVIERINRIGQTLAAIANETEVKACYGSSEITKFQYVFKVIDDKDVNAFSLPGGIIYVNSGLIELAGSDDEIAGVLAHEIAHAAHHHMVHLIRKQSKVDRLVALVALAGMLSNMRKTDLNNLLYGAQMIKTGKMSGYTMEAEKDADRTAVAYLAKSPYNPEGMLRFMKKLDEQADANPGVSLGIYQTHPSPFRRIASITQAMKEQGIDIDIRKARGVVYARAVPASDDDTRYDVVIGKKLVYAPAGLSAGSSSQERANALASTINKALDAGITPRDLSESATHDRLLARGQELLTVEDADTRLSGQDKHELLARARSALEYAIWAEWLCDRCPLDPMQNQSD